MHQHHHPVHKDNGHEGALDRFQMVIAIAVTIIATLSALVGLKNKSTSLAISLCQVRGNDLWSWYQAKSVKHSLAEDRADIGRTELEDPQVDDAKKKYWEKVIADRSQRMDRYKKEMEETRTKAEHLESLAAKLTAVHEQYELAEMCFYIAISTIGIAALIRGKKLLGLGICLSVVGIAFAVFGLISGLHLVLH